MVIAKSVDPSVELYKRAEEGTLKLDKTASSNKGEKDNNNNYKNNYNNNYKGKNY